MNDNTLQQAIADFKENKLETNIARVSKYINQLYEKNGSVTSEELVEFARPEDSPIHDCFPWDDKELAENARKYLANQYILKVKVKFLTDDEQEERTVKAFRNVNVKYIEDGEEKTKKGYVRIDEIYSDEDKRKYVIQDLIQRQKYWTNQAKEFTELDKIVDINELEKVASRI